MNATILGPKNAALLLRPRGSPESANKNSIGIFWMNYNSTYTSGLIQSHVLPGLAGISGFVDAVPHDVTVADGPSFACAGPDLSWVRRSDGQRADSRGRLIVEDCGESIRPVRALPHSA